MYSGRPRAAVPMPIIETVGPPAPSVRCCIEGVITPKISPHRWVELR
jgi:hypothetical protein